MIRFCVHLDELVLMKGPELEHNSYTATSTLVTATASLPPPNLSLGLNLYLFRSTDIFFIFLLCWSCSPWNHQKALRNPTLDWPFGHKVHDLTGHLSLLGLAVHWADQWVVTADYLCIWSFHVCNLTDIPSNFWWHPMDSSLVSKSSTGLSALSSLGFE